MKTINERNTEVGGTAAELVEWSPARRAKVEALATKLREGLTTRIDFWFYEQPTWWSPARKAKIEKLAAELCSGVSYPVTGYPFAI